ncbi:sushi repeat-containing protein SRPX isoform X3 [Mustelus asterias]
MDISIKCILLSAVCIFTAEAYRGSGYGPLEDDEDANEARYARYEDIPWCAPLKITNGYVHCRTPHGGYYKNVQGTACDISCRKGYEIHGASRVHCLSNKRWSQTVACREIRCPKFSLPLHGGAKCSDGAYFNSRCEFYCTPGYQVKGQKNVICMHNKRWSGTEPSCLDLDPPKIRCPSFKEKTAEPEKLTVRVNWDTPEGKDTADGILTNVILKGPPPRSEFPEGQHKIQYTVFDRAGNKASCRFTIKVKAMNINVGVTTATALLEQFYEKRRLLIISTPSGANHYYRFQLGIIQQAICGFDLRHMTVIELVGVYPVIIGRIRERFLSPFLVLQLRLLLRISQSNFNMVLVDKYGMDKERYPFPVTAAELFTLIDTFSLRKKEIKLQAENGQSCN